MATPHHHDATRHDTSNRDAGRLDTGRGHVHGQMDITTHERDFRGFVRFAVWNVVAIFAVLTFLVLVNS